MNTPKEKLVSTLIAFALAIISCATAPMAAAQTKSDAPDVQHDIYGTVRSVDGAKLSIETRAKKTIQVDTKAAAEAQRAVVLVVGHAVLVHGAYDAKGVLRASSIQRAKSSPALWPEDK